MSTRKLVRIRSEFQEIEKQPGTVFVFNFLKQNLTWYQGRTGTKFPTGHKPPTGAAIRVVARTLIQRGKNDRDKICLVKSGYLPTDIYPSAARQNDRAKQGSKQLGVWGTL